MPGYHAEVSEPGAEPPVARRSFATLDGALDRVMWRKVDNPDLIGRIVTDDPITAHRLPPLIVGRCDGGFGLRAVARWTAFGLRVFHILRRVMPDLRRGR
jgi:hypothetical protein